MDKIEVLVLGLSAYDFEDKDTKKRIQGCNVWFIEKAPVSTESQAGFLPKKVKVHHNDFTIYQKHTFPFVADAHLVARFTTKGVQTDIEKFTFKNTVKLG